MVKDLHSITLRLAGLLFLINVTTINLMKFIFDPAKDKLNSAKHGLSLSEAVSLEWDDALMWIDDRKDYGEKRSVALVPMKRRLYCIVYVETRSAKRIIGLRKANNREIDRYEKEIN